MFASMVYFTVTWMTGVTVTSMEENSYKNKFKS